MRAIHLLLVLSLAVLGGCASAPHTVTPPIPSTPAPAPTAHHDELLFHAFSLVGTPYRYGGSSPDTGFDCSGLINYVYREAAGVALPRTTADAGRSGVVCHGRQAR